MRRFWRFSTTINSKKEVVFPKCDICSNGKRNMYSPRKWLFDGVSDMYVYLCKSYENMMILMVKEASASRKALKPFTAHQKG